MDGFVYQNIHADLIMIVLKKIGCIREENDLLNKPYIFVIMKIQKNYRGFILLS